MDQLRRPLKPARPQPPAALLLLAAVVALVGAGCAPAGAVALEHGFESPDALARAVVAALNERRDHALAAYALSEHELRTRVWPHLPASRPAVGMSWDYFWRDHRQRSTGHLRRLLEEHGGRVYQVDRLTFDGRASYGPVTIHREPVIDLRTPDGPKRVRLFGSMAEIDGRWKLYSFVVD